MDTARRDQGVRNTLWVTGGANLAVFVVKLWVGLATGSLSVLGDAAHSLTDLANNAIALLVLRVAASPPDREHPYGHRKFETLAVFGLATLLTVLAFELGSRAVSGEREPPVDDDVSLALMIGVLVVNVGVTSWEGYWARKLRSPLLAADAHHTFSDVLVTLAVIAGWQGAAHGYPWLDRVTAVGVAALVFVVAYRLFQRAVPVLVDAVAVEPARLHDLVCSVPVYTSANIAIDTNADAVSAVFAPQAIAFDVRRAYRLEPERDASLRAWELNATMVYAYGLGERPAWGVKITADATAP